MSNNPTNTTKKQNTIPSVFDHECERPACGDIQQMYQKHQKQQQQISNPTVPSSSSSNTLKNPTENPKASSDVIKVIDDTPQQMDKSECPVDSSTLGRASWTLLHSMVAWYPDQPSIDDQNQITNFFHTLGQFYPCTYCASDFQINIQKHPIKVQSREELCIWLCQQHNKVNQKLGKGIFPCTIQKLDHRWRKSNDPKC